MLIRISTRKEAPDEESDTDGRLREVDAAALLELEHLLAENPDLLPSLDPDERERELDVTRRLTRALDERNDHSREVLMTLLGGLPAPGSSPQGQRPEKAGRHPRLRAHPSARRASGRLGRPDPALPAPRPDGPRLARPPSPRREGSPRQGHLGGGSLDGNSRAGTRTRTVLRQLGVRKATDLIKAFHPEEMQPEVLHPRSTGWGRYLQGLEEESLKLDQLSTLVRVLSRESALVPVWNWGQRGVRPAPTVETARQATHVLG